jgi:hypothetical protein
MITVPIIRGHIDDRSYGYAVLQRERYVAQAAGGGQRGGCDQGRRRGQLRGNSIGQGDRIIPGTKGELVIKEFPAAQLPETAEVHIGEGGRGGTRGDLTVPGGRPGWAVIITHLEN